MAKTIKASPVLKGKDIDRFIDYITTAKKASKEELARMRKNHKKVLEMTKA
jgi:hypothetical protein